jgi:drug/metabolite transporter (DMT)-like permease
METTAFLLTLFSSFLWGISPIITKRLIMKYDRYTIMILFSFTYVFCLLLTIPYYGKGLIKDMVKFDNSDVLIILFQGIFVLFFGNIIYYYVLKDNNTSLITALESCAPFFTLILSYFLLNEKINISGVIGIVFIVVGVFFISYNDTKLNVFETFLSKD